MATSTNPGGASGSGRPAAASAVPVIPPVRPLPGQQQRRREEEEEDASQPQPVVGGGGGVPHALMYLSLRMDAKSPRDEVHLEVRPEPRLESAGL